jgi:hypothetical protein
LGAEFAALPFRFPNDLADLFFRGFGFFMTVSPEPMAQQNEVTGNCRFASKRLNA